MLTGFFNLKKKNPLNTQIYIYTIIIRENRGTLQKYTDCQRPSRPGSTKRCNYIYTVGILTLLIFITFMIQTQFFRKKVSFSTYYKTCAKPVIDKLVVDRRRLSCKR